jgi:cobalt transporter subunit CbtA
MQKILITALIAGLFAGFISFGVQAFKLSPLILHAEVFEDAAAAKEAAMPGHDHDHGEDEWQPANGFERKAYRAVADLGVGVGYALVLIGAFSLRGDRMTAQRGLFWGLAGFAVFALAPGFGLPPELPGTLSADLTPRQLWWASTAAATALGLALMVFGRSNGYKALGLAALILPHVIGAPHPETLGGPVPPELNAEFAAASLATAAIFWVVLGTVSGWLYGRKDNRLPV